METVTHDGRETAYRIARPDGDGPATLYVHGSGGNHRVWTAQYGPRGPAHPAIALDLSGHGASGDVDTAPGPETLRAYAADVAAVASETGADVLVGNSLGGAVVFRTLLADAWEPEAVVFAGTGAKLAVRDRLRELLADDYEAAVDFLHADSRLLSDADGAIVDRSRETMRAAGQRVTRRDFLSCHTFDVRDRLDEIEVPALAVVGEHDGLTPPRFHEYLADQLPDCELAVVENAAHLAMIEQPRAFNAAIEQFLERI
jgi:3-oxoadipate enol-lactonase